MTEQNVMYTNAITDKKVKGTCSRSGIGTFTKQWTYDTRRNAEG